MPRKRAHLRIQQDSSDSDYSPILPKSRNMKKLSLTLPSSAFPEPHSPSRPRRPSVISLPAPPTAASLLYRREEEASPTIPYPDGPVQVIPGIWLGSEDNARDWKSLVERGIRSILNVAKEVASPLDSAVVSQPLRAVASAPNFQKSRNSDSTYHPPNLATGRPPMHYLKLQWSHGQQDLVDVGFHAAMAFTDAALERGDGVLIHCQCGISRSATMVIALVMRAAAQQSPSVPPEVWALDGYQGAYEYVKQKSKWVGPNMSLIYQLLEYEKKLKGALSEQLTDEEEEWGRRRRMLDDTSSDDRESAVVMHEAEALDKAMEDRIVARKSSASSITSTVSTGSGVGMGAAWRDRYGPTRKRTESIASNITNGSVISEDLVEEDEEEELLGIGGGFDDERRRSISTETEDSSTSNSPDDPDPSQHLTPIASPPQEVRPPPSPPVWKTSFNIPPPPPTAVRSTFNIPPRVVLKPKRRPPPIVVLPPVPSSPITAADLMHPSVKPTKLPVHRASTTPAPPTPLRPRTEPKRLVPPPLHIRNSVLRSSSPNAVILDSSFVSTPSQTLFVFPPSPTSTLTTRTPSTMTLTGAHVPFPSIATPRVSTFRSHGRTRSFIGLGVSPAPTTAFSKVDVRGYLVME
ncbi:phosphatases II [Tricholoma matsutake]|nr:phosphatases II [Tricholoma matsutake 945]